jgi:hypothetical protein
MSPGNRLSLKGRRPASETITPTTTSVNPATISSFPIPTIPVYGRVAVLYFFNRIAGFYWLEPQTGIEGTKAFGSSPFWGETIGIV